MDLSLIFSAPSLVKSLAELMGVIQSLDSKVNLLLESPLKSGLDNLEQARVSSSEQRSLLREARSKFNEATNLESGFRQGLAYLGLAVCHNHLKDPPNERRALESLLELPPAVSNLDKVIVGVGTITEGGGEPLTGMLFGLFGAIGRKMRPSTDRLWSSGDWSYPRPGEGWENAGLFDQINRNIEARSLYRLQQYVARHLDRPIRWEAELESS